MSAVSCAIVGDGMVGKTCLAKQFSGLEVTENYVATIMDIFSGTASAYGEQYKINIKDTAGQVRYFISFFFIVNNSVHFQYQEKRISFSYCIQ